MYPEAAYWILGSIMMVTATLIGFILIAAVFYVERSRALFDTVMKAVKSMMDLAEDTGSRNEEFRSVKALAWSESRKEFAKFIGLLLATSGIGLLAILFSVQVISTIPDGSLPLTNIEIARVNLAIILFAAFLIAAIATVIRWITSGFVMATFLTAKFEGLEQALKLLPGIYDRIGARVRTVFEERAKAEEQRLGRKPSREELSALLEPAEYEDSDIGKEISNAIREEKERILRVAGRAPKGIKKSRE